MSFPEVSRRVEELRDECVRFLIHICSIPALGPTNQGHGEMEKYQVVREMVRSLNPDSEV